MKTRIIYLVFSILIGLIISPIQVQATPITIGSNVSIPTVDYSNLNTVFSLVGGDIVQDIIIDGDVEFFDIEHLTFNLISISGGNLTFHDCLYFTFRGCTIHDGNSIIFNSSLATSNGSTFDTWDLIEVNEGSQLINNTGSIFLDVDLITLNNCDYFKTEETTFNNSSIVSSGNNRIVVNNSIFINSTTAALTLDGGGEYIGDGNEFHDNKIAINRNALNGSLNLKEENSEFYDNEERSVSLKGISEITLSGNTFNESLENESIIEIYYGTGPTLIEDNIINGNDVSSRGIDIFSRGTTEISGNYVEGVTNFGMYLAMINGLIVGNNNVYDNDGAYGIRVEGCNDAHIVSNDVSEHINNIEILMCEGANVESNICSYSSNANIYITNSQKLTLCSNSCYYGDQGITIESTNMMLEVNDNSMSHCATGLVYKQDILTSAQIEKGNYFLLNTLGAQYEGATDPDIINSMRYVVLNNSTGFPSYSPNHWFQATGTQALDCTPIGPIPPAGISLDVNRLIKCAGEISPDGKCLNDMMIGLEMIEDQPDFLDDKDINDFYDLYYQTVVDMLPTIQNVYSHLELFPETTPVAESDEDGFISNVAEQEEYLSDTEEAYNDLMTDQVNSLLSLKSDVEEIDPENQVEENYQFAILKLIDLLVGDTLTTGEKSDIIDFAEGCVVDDGPAVYVSQIIANAIKLDYTKASSCTPVTPRSENVNSEKQLERSISIFPNPCSDALYFSYALNQQMIKIYDILGNLVSSYNEFSGRKLNINGLSSGIYFLQLDGCKDQIKFVKSLK